MKATYAIESRGLEKFYGKVHALRGVDFDVERGEIFGFLGPNGAGKTTTIRCLLDLIRPQKGIIRVLGIDPQADPVAVRKRTGYLPGELSLEDNLKTIQQLRYFKDLRGNKVDWTFVNELAERLELDMSIPIKNLSKGNKQKVGVIQALMHKPELLIMDEPTAGLDPLKQQEVFKLLKEAQAEGTTIFFSSHIINEVEILADEVGIINNGVIIEEAYPDKLMHMEMRRLNVQFKGEVDPTPLNEVQGVTVLSQDMMGTVTLQVEGDMDQLIKALGNYPVSDLDLEHPSLEEIFMAYYASDIKETE